MLSSAILSLGHCVPPDEVPNEALAPLFGVSTGDMFERTGIRARRFARSMSCADLAEQAARSCAGADTAQAILFATLSPDRAFPGPGCELQQRLGLAGVPVFELRNQCCGFLYGLVMADHLIRCNTYSRVLVAASERQSPGLRLSPEASDVGMLFGDGATCALIGPSEESGILASRLGADGRFAEALCFDSEPRMDGAVVFRHAVKTLSQIVPQTLADAGASIAGVDRFVFHQSNARLLDAVARRLGIPESKMSGNIDRYGNTSGASIPLVLSEAPPKRGELVLLTAFGAGFSWACVLLRF
jgi:3-oxoacyl-[acyl-carrier-protein] synthase-3